MIHGDKPSGYFETKDRDGRRVEGETRQCGHCQFIWQYKPGSGRRSGLCMACNALICARPECLRDQAEKKAIIFAEDGKAYDCVPFDVWNYRLMEKAAKVRAKLGVEYEMTDKGFILPK